MTNVAAHYRLPLFLRLARAISAHFVFFSDGQEWYWQKTYRLDVDLPAVQLKGLWVGKTRITPGLIYRVAFGNHDVIIKCINGKFALPTTYIIARLTRRRFVLWASMWVHPAGWMHKLSRPLVAHIYRHADAVVTYGEHVSKFVIGEGASPSRVIVAPQAVDLKLFSVGEHDGGPRATTILYVGRMEIAKGPQLLLQALANLDRSGVPYQARFVGDGPLRPHLEKAAHTYGVADRITFLGYSPNTDLPLHYRWARVTVIPSMRTSNFAEPWSLAVNEAMGCGSVVVASSEVGAVRHGLIKAGDTGLVFEAGDTDELASKLGRLMLEPEAAERLAIRGHKAIADYSYEAAVAGFARAVDMARRSRDR